MSQGFGKEKQRNSKHDIMCETEAKDLTRYENILGICSFLLLSTPCGCSVCKGDKASEIE